MTNATAPRSTAGPAARAHLSTRFTTVVCGPMAARSPPATVIAARLTNLPKTGPKQHVLRHYGQPLPCASLGGGVAVRPDAHAADRPCYAVYRPAIRHVGAAPKIAAIP